MILYFIITLITMTIEAFAGFGGNAIGMPFLTLSMPTADAVVLLSFNALLVNLFICLTQFKKIVWREYARVALPILAIIPFGVAIYASLSAYEPALKLILGVVISAIAAKYIYDIYIKKADIGRLSPSLRYGALFLGAIVQGMFSTGGPIMAVYITNTLDDKSEFRATMSAVWITLIIETTVIRLFFTDMYRLELIFTGLKAIPILALGLVLGMFLHERVDNAKFKRYVYFVLLAGGLTSIINALTILL